MKPSAVLFWLAVYVFAAANQASPAEIAGDRKHGRDADGWTPDLVVGTLGRIGEVVFAVRSIVAEHWYANFGYFSPDENHKCYGKEGRLCKLDLATGRLTVLVDDPEGAVRDPCVHYDGRRIVFSYRPGGTETYYRTLLAMCAAGRRWLEEIKRFDMPGFRPRPEYVREMKRYGVLPPEFDPSRDPLDVYRAEHTYWQLVAWKPAASG